MELLERVARAMCNEGLFDPDEVMANDGPRWKYYVPQAKAAIRAMLDGVEPVALMHEHNDEMTEFARYAHGSGCITDGDRKAGWTETPLYSLDALKEAL